MEQWRLDAEETGHGMVLVTLSLMMRAGYLATCHCGWFATKEVSKPDMAAADWRAHLDDI